MCNNSERTPHKHADLIKAWADGAEVQYWANDWYDVDNNRPTWCNSIKYRIKPEQSDLEKYGVQVGDVWSSKSGWVLVRNNPMVTGLVKILEFDDSITSEVSRTHLSSLIFRRGVVNKL